jgi:hypothetical protein
MWKVITLLNHFKVDHVKQSRSSNDSDTLDQYGNFDTILALPWRWVHVYLSGPIGYNISSNGS